MKNIKKLISILFTIGVITPSFAQNAPISLTENFQTKATIADTCSFQFDNLNFGVLPPDPISLGVYGSMSYIISIKCTRGTKAIIRQARISDNSLVYPRVHLKPVGFIGNDYLTAEFLIAKLSATNSMIASGNGNKWGDSPSGDIRQLDYTGTGASDTIELAVFLYGPRRVRADNYVGNASAMIIY